MFHELGQIQERLCDLWDVLWRQGLLQTVDQLILLRLAQLRPTRDKRSVEQVPVNT